MAHKTSCRLDKSQIASLALALNKGDSHVVRTLLKHAGSVDVCLPRRQNRPANETSLMLVAEKGNLPLARLLMSLGSDLNATNEYRQSPLQYATAKNQMTMVSLFLKSGADPNLRFADQDFVLLTAATSPIDLRITQTLIKYGADPCFKNKRQVTALHIAALHGRADVARILIRAGADVNCRDRYGHGPLACAISRNQKEMANLLLEHGADPCLQPEALGLAAWEGRLLFVKLLIDRGWDINSKSHQGRTPLQHARNRNHKAVIQALVDAGAKR